MSAAHQAITGSSTFANSIQDSNEFQPRLCCADEVQRAEKTAVAMSETATGELIATLSAARATGAGP
jgi:hypothetical protein